MARSRSEATRYYYCDPFIPGLFPSSAAAGVDPRRPLRHFPGRLAGNLTDEKRGLIAAKGATSVEIGFVMPLHPLDQRQLNIRRMLGGVAGQLRLAQMALGGEADGIMDESDLAYFRAQFSDAASIPSTVVAHTRAGVAILAETDFEFRRAISLESAPEQRVNAIEAMGYRPVTIYMPMEQFLVIGNPPLAV